MIVELVLALTVDLWAMHELNMPVLFWVPIAEASDYHS